MGSSCAYKPANMSPVEFLDKEGYFGGENKTHSWELVSKSEVGNLVYAVIDEREKENGAVRRCLFIIKYSLEGNEICWKVIDEEAGPVDASCPVSLLKLMGPPRNKYAEDWRAKCLANAAFKKERAKLAKSVRDGDILVLTRPINLVSGESFDEIVVVDWARRIFGLGVSRGKISAVVLNSYGWSIKRLDEERNRQAAAEAVPEQLNGELFTTDQSCYPVTW